MAHSYDVGTKAWQPDATEGWVASEVTSKKVDGDKIFLVFELVNGEVCSSPEASCAWSVSLETLDR
jgi:myosin heavy subunit